MEKSDILLTGLLKRTIQIGKLMDKNYYLKTVNSSKYVNQLMGIEAFK